ncbi:MAG: hypothetical protein ACRC1K_13190 [Planctomycetia bacterium]
MNAVPLTQTERMHRHNLYLCVLVRGADETGVPLYAYFSLFLSDFERLLSRSDPAAPFNPKDLNAIVLARSTGTPTPEIRDFMQHKFSFTDAAVTLEVSRGD